MIRFVALTTCLFVFFGCVNQSTPTTPPGSSSPTEKDSGFPIDYKSWPELTKEPVQVPASIATLCAPPQVVVAKKFGPHYGKQGEHTARYFIYPTSEDVFRSNQKPLPVGTVVIKEKWQKNEKGSPRLTAVTAMVKHEPGYSKDNGDWEYLYGEVPSDNKAWDVKRGQISSCVECHARAWENDFLYRSYLLKNRDRLP